MRNRILEMVRSWRGASLRRIMPFLQAGIYAVADRVQEKRKMFRVQHKKWMRKGINDFYTMIQHYKR